LDLRKYWQKTWQKWRSKSTNKSSITEDGDLEINPSSDSATNKTLDSLRHILKDEHIPASVRMQLGDEYQQVQQLVDKLENEQVHIVVFGKVSSGKSSLLNALLGKATFTTSPLHGETKAQKSINWNQYNDQNMVVIDTPGTDEVQGSQREHMAHEAAEIADIILFVVDGDLTQSQLSQLKTISQPNTQIILVLNKADLYTEQELKDLKESLITKTSDIIQPDNIVIASAAPLPQLHIIEDEKGKQIRKRVAVEVDVQAVKQRVWDILEQDGKTLTALNASIFAGEISNKIAKKITKLRSLAAEKVVTTYSIAKGVGVAFNPIPVADLLIAAGLDVAMIRKLSQVYGLPIVGKEASKLTMTIMAQLALLMGAVWGVNLVSSALKTVSAGLSTTVTAGAQGALAYYATYLVGKIAEQYFIRGKSWGDKGPKKVAKDIVNSLDKNSILAEARDKILQRINNK
jgi:small GTP-binding protein